MYPFSNLAIIAPIFFIVLLVITPIIGALAGWKRAAFWAGGNFVFYVIGLLIWTFAGTSITKSLQPLLEKVITKFNSSIKASDLTTLAKSLVTPVFFIIVLLLSNLILLINYYAWYKRVVGLKKSKEEKAAIKAAKANGTPVAKVKLQYHPKANKVYNKKPFNIAVGAIGMEILMLPTIFTFTQAVYFGTTSATTRASNSFSSKIYNALQGASKKLNWFSYYTSDETGKDFDALYGLIGMSSKKITYTDINGNEKEGTPIDAITSTVSTGMTDVVNKTKDADISTKAVAESSGLLTSISNFSNSWDSIIKECGNDAEAVFNSTGVTEAIKGAIGIQEGQGQTKIDEDTYTKQFDDENSTFNKMVKAYQDGASLHYEDGDATFTTIQNPIGTSETAFNNIVDSIFTKFDVSELDSDQQAVMKNKAAELVSMMVYVK